MRAVAGEQSNRPPMPSAVPGFDRRFVDTTPVQIREARCQPPRIAKGFAWRLHDLYATSTSQVMEHALIFSGWALKTALADQIREYSYFHHDPQECRSFGAHWHDGAVN